MGPVSYCWSRLVGVEDWAHSDLQMGHAVWLVQGVSWNSLVSPGSDILWVCLHHCLISSHLKEWKQIEYRTEECSWTDFTEGCAPGSPKHLKKFFSVWFTRNYFYPFCCHIHFMLRLSTILKILITFYLYSLSKLWELPFKASQIWSPL